MSFHVASVCTRHKFGSATRKQVITFLADKASDDGSGIWDLVLQGNGGTKH